MSKRMSILRPRPRASKNPASAFQARGLTGGVRSGERTGLDRNRVERSNAATAPRRRRSSRVQTLARKRRRRTPAGANANRPCCPRLPAARAAVPPRGPRSSPPREPTSVQVLRASAPWRDSSTTSAPGRQTGTDTLTARTRRMVAAPSARRRSGGYDARPDQPYTGVRHSATHRAIAPASYLEGGIIGRQLDAATRDHPEQSPSSACTDSSSAPPSATTATVTSINFASRLHVSGSAMSVPAALALEVTW